MICRNALVGLLLVVLHSLSNPVSAQDPNPDKLPPRDKFYLFLLVGQSNMAGRGEVSDDDKTPVARVLMLNKENQWVPAVDPLHFDKPKAAGTGLGKTFGVEMAKAYPDAIIGLIPCAVGGSPISAWEPGAYDEPTRTHPWDDCRQRAHIALRSGTLKGILWHQGESDSSASLAPVYEEKLRALIERFRAEFDAPDVPFLIGQLGQFDKQPWNDAKKQVDSTHQKLARELPHVVFIGSGELKDKGDGVHFDAASYRELGRRFAAAYLQMLGQQ